MSESPNIDLRAIEHELPQANKFVCEFFFDRYLLGLYDDSHGKLNSKDLISNWDSYKNKKVNPRALNQIPSQVDRKNTSLYQLWVYAASRRDDILEEGIKPTDPLYNRMLQALRDSRERLQDIIEDAMVLKSEQPRDYIRRDQTQKPHPLKPESRKLGKKIV
jgi:hypothetical protein